MTQKIYHKDNFFCHHQKKKHIYSSFTISFQCCYTFFKILVYLYTKINQKSCFFKTCKKFRKPGINLQKTFYNPVLYSVPSKVLKDLLFKCIYGVHLDLYKVILFCRVLSELSVIFNHLKEFNVTFEIKQSKLVCSIRY